MPRTARSRTRRSRTRRSAAPSFGSSSTRSPSTGAQRPQPACERAPDRELQSAAPDAAWPAHASRSSLTCLLTVCTVAVISTLFRIETMFIADENSPKASGLPEQARQQELHRVAGDDEVQLRARDREHAAAARCGPAGRRSLRLGSRAVGCARRRAPGQHRGVRARPPRQARSPAGARHRAQRACPAKLAVPVLDAEADRSSGSTRALTAFCDCLSCGNFRGSARFHAAASPKPRRSDPEEASETWQRSSASTWARPTRSSRSWRARSPR